MIKPSPSRIAELNKGLFEATNLMESLAIDFSILLKHTLPTFTMPLLPEKCGITKKMRLVAAEIYNQKGVDIVNYLATHPADTLRSLSCYILSCAPLPFAEKLHRIMPLADDQNSGVREWAWLALRPELSQNLTQGIDILTGWTVFESANIRRYACEMTRPRGVWCTHLTLLRQAPWQALSILSPLNNDTARYVQLSVGNWLNDAGKDHPEWVKNLCQEWREISPTPETLKICNRALRNLKD